MGTGRARGVTASVEHRFTPTDWALFLGVSGIWGASFLFIAEGLEVMEPGLVTWARVGSGAAVLALVRGGRRRVASEDRVPFVLLSVLWVGVPFTLFPLAQEHVSSAVAGMLNGATPVWTALVGLLWLRAAPSPATTVGLGVGLAGVVTISLAQGGVGESAWVGILLVVAATLCYGFAIHIAAPLQARYGSVTTMGRMLALATVWTAPLGLWSIPGSSFEWMPVLAVTVLGVVGTGVAFLLMGSLVGRVGGTRSAFITYVVPVIAMSLGIGLRGDEVRPAAGFGVALVIAGAILASRGRVVGPAGGLSQVADGPDRAEDGQPLP